MQPSHERFYHPYEPYGIQLDFMQKLYECIENRQVAIFESPTGTGKSLSLVCASLTWLRDNEMRDVSQNDNEGSDDWLANAEQLANQRQKADLKKEVEDKLLQIRQQAVRKRGVVSRHTKKVKVGVTQTEDQFALEEYENIMKAKDKQPENLLSSSTQALLDQLLPDIDLSNNEILEASTQIIVCSRTHSQLSQLVSELQKVDVHKEVIKHTPLGSRRQLCINPSVSQLSSTKAINEKCLELQKSSLAKEQRCQYLPNAHDVQDRTRLQFFTDHTIAAAQDIEDITELGAQQKICPYYATRYAAQQSEIVTLPYPLLLQKASRQALGLSIQNNIVIIDEAHNLADAIAEALSVNISITELETAETQVLGYCQKFRNRLKGGNRVYIAQLIKMLKVIISNVMSLAKVRENRILEPSSLLKTTDGVEQIQPLKLAGYIQSSKLVHKVEGYTEHIEKTNPDSRAPSLQSKQSTKGALSNFQSLLTALATPDKEGKFFITFDDCKPQLEPVLKYVLLDPEEQFRDVVESARCVILAGGTMSPMTDYTERLFSYLDPSRFESFSFSHIVAKENILVQAVSRASSGTEFDFTFQQRSSTAMVVELGKTILRLCSIAPDGMVIFFPSYDYLAFVESTWSSAASGTSIWEDLHKLRPTFVEKREAQAEELLQSFSSAVLAGRGALLLAVVGGKLSEGINFSDALGRVVICVGLPYPNMQSAEWRAKLEYVERSKYEKLVKSGVTLATARKQAQAAARDFTDNVTMRAVNQSIGRAIRHKHDYAAIYLIDKRYATPRVQSRLPTWLQESVRASNSSWQQIEQEMREFFAISR